MGGPKFLGGPANSGGCGKVADTMSNKWREERKKPHRKRVREKEIKKERKQRKRERAEKRKRK